MGQKPPLGSGKAWVHLEGLVQCPGRVPDGGQADLALASSDTVPDCLGWPSPPPIAHSPQPEGRETEFSNGAESWIQGGRAHWATEHSPGMMGLLISIPLARPIGGVSDLE